MNKVIKLCGKCPHIVENSREVVGCYICDRYLIKLEEFNSKVKKASCCNYNFKGVKNGKENK